MKIKIETFNNDFVKDCMLVLDKMDIKPGLQPFHNDVNVTSMLKR
jgi:hypothetical protein